MPLKIPDNLPARAVLENEGVGVIRNTDALRQDVRPMRIALLNLMPKKVETEVHLARLLSHSPLQVELTLLTTESYRPTNTSSDYMATFYQTLSTVRHEHFDGLVVTGAPVEEMPFEEVNYWPELRDIFDWADENVFRQFNICWGAQAGLYHRFGIPKHALGKKLFGVYEQRVLDSRAQLTRGLPEIFLAPVSRHTGTLREDVEQHPELSILAESDASGLCLVMDRRSGDVFMFNHLEYEADTLRHEYLRDRFSGRADVGEPYNYPVGDAGEEKPVNTWRPFAYLLFGNWINQLYQDVPFETAAIPHVRRQALGIASRKVADTG